MAAFMEKRLSKKAFPAGILVTFIIFVLFIPSLYNGFVFWDDGKYVYENPWIRHIDTGFFKWAFKAVVASNWHPLTLFSLALDYSAWGLNPLGYHLTNNVLHALNTFLVFVLYVRLIEEGFSRRVVEGANPYQRQNDKTNQLSQILIPAFIAALLFGIHPLRVESVSWVSERKDVLCAFFFLSALISYVSYVSSSGRRRTVFYISSLFLFTLSLLSKPMAVTLPVVLLILDLYPLKRSGRNIWMDKAPFIILALMASLTAVWAQEAGGALRSIERFPLAVRLFVAVNSCVFYLVKTLFPFNLAPFYPYPKEIVIFTPEYLGPLAAFLFISSLSIILVRRNILFASVWFYYIVTLLPVIGIVQVGNQAAADRYTYIPGIGPFLLVGVFLGRQFEGSKKHKAIISILLAFLVLLLGFKTVRQIHIWRDSITFWSYEIRHYPDVSLAYFNRGETYLSLGRYREAINDFGEVIRLVPEDADAHLRRGEAFLKTGDMQSAFKDYRVAGDILGRILKKAPSDTESYYKRGIIHRKLGENYLAVKDFDNVIRLKPRHMQAYNNRGNAYTDLGEYLTAVKDYDKAIKINRRDAISYNNRGNAYRGLGLYREAVRDYMSAIEVEPDYAEAYYNLGSTYSLMGYIEKGSLNYKKAAALGLREPSPSPH